MLEALVQALFQALMHEEVLKVCEAQLLMECKAQLKALIACTPRSQPLLRGPLPAFQVRSQSLLRDPHLVEAKEEPSWGQRLLVQRPLRNLHRGTT